jgi:hypothetical protein
MSGKTLVRRDSVPGPAGQGLSRAPWGDGVCGRHKIHSGTGTIVPLVEMDGQTEAGLGRAAVVCDGFVVILEQSQDGGGWDPQSLSLLRPNP